MFWIIGVKWYLFVVIVWFVANGTIELLKYPTILLLFSRSQSHFWHSFTKQFSVRIYFKIFQQLVPVDKTIAVRMRRAYGRRTKYTVHVSGRAPENTEMV